MKISILELGSRDNHYSIDTIPEIIEYAKASENLGFYRFWLAEHHVLDKTNAYTNPDVLLTLVAGSTETIRVGAGGVLIGYYSPYSIVSNYKLLNNIFSNRIDLGFAKGKPYHSEKHDFFRLNNKAHFNLFNDNLRDIIDLFYNEKYHMDTNEIVIPPHDGNIPKLWYLSSTYSYLDYAKENKLNYCRSLFHGINSFDLEIQADRLIDFKQQYYDIYKIKPETAVAVAISFTMSEKQVKFYDDKMRDIPGAIKIIRVTKESVGSRISEIAEKYGVDEVFIVDQELNNDKRIENLHIVRDSLKINTYRDND